MIYLQTGNKLLTDGQQTTYRRATNYLQTGNKLLLAKVFVYAEIRRFLKNSY